MKIINYLRLPVFLLLVFCGVSLSAQWRVGIQGGYTHNTLSASTGYFYDWNYAPLGGFTVGVPVQYEFADWFALQADLSYIEKGYNIHRSGFFNGVYTNIKNGYLQLPVYTHFSFGGNKLRGFLNLGAYGGYWLSSKREGVMPQFIEGTIYNFNERVPFDSRRDNRFEGGLLMGIGLQYQVAPRVQLVAEGRYYYSLTDLQKHYMKNQMPRYSNTLVFQIGCLVTLGNLPDKEKSSIELY